MSKNIEIVSNLPTSVKMQILQALDLTQESELRNYFFRSDDLKLIPVTDILNNNYTSNCTITATKMNEDYLDLPLVITIYFRKNSSVCEGYSFLFNKRDGLAKFLSTINNTVLMYNNTVREQDNFASYFTLSLLTIGDDTHYAVKTDLLTPKDIETALEAKIDLRSAHSKYAECTVIFTFMKYGHSYEQKIDVYLQEITFIYYCTALSSILYYLKKIVEPHFPNTVIKEVKYTLIDGTTHNYIINSFVTNNFKQYDSTEIIDSLTIFCE